MDFYQHLSDEVFDTLCLTSTTKQKLVFKMHIHFDNFVRNTTVQNQPPQNWK